MNDSSSGRNKGKNDSSNGKNVNDSSSGKNKGKKVKSLVINKKVMKLDH